MRRITAGICLVAGVVSTGVPSALSQENEQSESALVDQNTLPELTVLELGGNPVLGDGAELEEAVSALKGDRPKLDVVWKKRQGPGDE